MVKEYDISNGDIQLSEHFRLHEFKSPDTEIILVDDCLIEMIEQIYRHFNCSKAIVTSGYRTPQHSIEVGGGENDAHTKGLAVDIIFYDSEEDVIGGSHICCYAQDIGFGGIGYMGNATHLDTRQNGDYVNDHWWGDETTGNNVSDWHSYFGLVKYDDTDNEPEEEQEPSETETSFEGGNMTNITDREQLKYEVDRHALTLLGREIGDADTYVDYLMSGEIDWYEFDKRLQESEEGVKFWIKHLFVDTLGRIPEQSEVDWWYAQYVLNYELNKALMAEGFSSDYEAFKNEYLNK